MKRIAIPLVRGRLSEHFGQCETYRIYQVENDAVSNETELVPEVTESSQLPIWAAEAGITDIIAHRVDKSIISLFAPYHINLFVGITLNSPENLISDYLNGRLRSDKKIILEIME